MIWQSHSALVRLAPSEREYTPSVPFYRADFTRFLDYDTIPFEFVGDLLFQFRCLLHDHYPQAGSPVVLEQADVDPGDSRDRHDLLAVGTQNFVDIPSGHDLL